MTKRTYSLIIAGLVCFFSSVRCTVAQPGIDDPLRHGYALIIGNSAYSEWQPLNDIALQVDQLKLGLERHFDNVEVVKNVKTEELRQRINNFLRTYGNIPSARLLIYYAGHGYSEPIIELAEMRGYITGIDTPSLTNGYDKVRPNAVSMDEIKGPLSNALAKHVLFIFDSCFSGTVFFTRAPSPLEMVRPDHGVMTRDELERHLTKRSRDIITAGDEKQTVPARSPLPKLFLDALDGGADKYGRGVISATQIKEYLVDKVSAMHINLLPMSGKLVDTRPAPGDFWFRVPVMNVPVAMAPVIPAPVIPAPVTLAPITKVPDTTGLGPPLKRESLLCKAEQVRNWLNDIGAYGGRPFDTSVYDDEVTWTVNGRQSKKTRSQISREEKDFWNVYPVQRYTPNFSKELINKNGNQCVITEELHAYKERRDGRSARNTYMVTFAIRTDVQQPIIVEQEIQILANN